MLIAPEGDPDAPDIPTPHSYAEGIEGHYSSQWQSAMDAEMASWKSIGTMVDDFPHLGRTSVKRPPGSPPAFKARYVARGFSQQQGVDFFQTFSPTPKMTTLRVLLQVAAQRDYELHSLDFSTAFLQGSLHEEIWLRRPPGFTGSFPADDLVFAIADTEALAHVKFELQKRLNCTDLAPPSDESVEPSGPYPELVGCLMYLMTCTRPDLAYPLSLLACYVAPGRHRKVHWDAAKRVLRNLGSTSGMGLVLGGRARVVLTGHADVSWVDDLATQRSSQGYTFSLGSDSVSWRSTRSSSVLSSSCEAEIYAGAMAAQELHWLTYLLTDLGEAPRSPPVLYVDNKAMLALCQEHRLEHRTKHIALRYFLARELQQHGQLCLAYVASQANTADVFTKALPPCDHQRFYTVLGLWHDTLRTSLAALGFTASTTDPSLFLCIDTSLPPFYVLVYVDDLVFATTDTVAVTLVKSPLARRTITLIQSHMVHQVLKRFVFQFSSPKPIPLSTDHSLSALPSNESVEPSGPYPELVGCLMHRKVHWDAAKRVLRYLCSTSGMGLVLGGRGPVVITGHADASWVDESATQWSSQGYTFSLGSGYVSWRSTHSSSFLSSSCEAEIYAGATAAQELR
ncbi:unnamed protein product [Closterium sp. NIES-54]